MATTYLKIDNVDFSDYIAYQGLGQEDETIVDEARDITGTMVGDVIARKQKILCHFRPLTQSEMTAFKNAIAPYFVTIKFFDNRTGSLAEKNCYVGNHNEKIWQVDSTGAVIRYSDFDCNFIER